MSLDHVAAPAGPVAATVREVPSVQRWTRHGYDRAYVRLGEQELGYCDLKTGQITCPRDGEPALVEAATADLLARVREQDAAYTPRHARPEPEALQQRSRHRAVGRDSVLRHPAVELRDAGALRAPRHLAAR